MLELDSVGANVLHSRSVEFAKKFDVPLQKRSSFTDTEGTWIVPETDWMRDIVVCGAALVRDEARVVLDGLPDRPGVSHRVFSGIAGQNIAVDMIAQNVGTGGKASIGFTVPSGELAATLAVIRPLAGELGAVVAHDESVSKVSIVGTGMRTHTGVALRMFAALAAAGINLKMVTTGDIKISALVDKADGVRALRAVHQAFALHEPRPGAGLPGRSRPATSFRRRPPEALQESGRDLTAVAQQLSSMEDIVVSDVLLNDDQGRITIFDLPDQPGVCSRVFQAVASGAIVVDMIVLNVTQPGRAELSFSVPRGDLARGLRLTQDVVAAMDGGTRAVGDPDIAKLFVLGVGMRTHTGVARRMFGTLAERGINIAMINTSEVRVSAVVDRARGEEALAALKAAFNVP
jgi:aspartate kinase